MFNNYFSERINESRKSTNRVYPGVIKVSKQEKNRIKIKTLLSVLIPI